jgi:hypothetical protein
LYIFNLIYLKDFFKNYEGDKKKLAEVFFLNPNGQIEDFEYFIYPEKFTLKNRGEALTSGHHINHKNVESIDDAHNTQYKCDEGNIISSVSSVQSDRKFIDEVVSPSLTFHYLVPLVDDEYGMFRITREELDRKKKKEKIKKLKVGESRILPNEAFDIDDSEEILRQQMTCLYAAYNRTKPNPKESTHNSQWRGIIAQQRTPIL